MVRRQKGAFWRSIRLRVLLDVSLEVADRLPLELGAPRFVALGLGHTADVALEAAVQAGSDEVRKGGLEGAEAGIEGQQRVPAESHDDGPVLGWRNRRSRLLRASPAA
jgi:hypothetical protein